MVTTENDDDDRRVHRRERRRERTDEDVESTCDEVQLRWRLSDTTGVPNVPADERQGASREESL